MQNIVSYTVRIHVAVLLLLLCAARRVMAANGKTYTLAEVGTHKTKDSCWLVMDGKVFDVTKFLSDVRSCLCSLSHELCELCAVVLVTSVERRASSYECARVRSSSCCSLKAGILSSCV